MNKLLPAPLTVAWAWWLENLAALAADDSDAPCTNTSPMFWGELLEPPAGVEEEA
jgi:hypothetical protein